MTCFLAVETAQWAAVYDDLKSQGVPDAVLEEGYRRAVSLRSVTDSPWFKLHSVLRTASAVASAYHGAKRNNGSVGWGLWWFLMGGMFPIVTPVIAVAQGYGKGR